jgi:soluble P-type ATPase
MSTKKPIEHRIVGLETESVNKPNDERTKNKVIYRMTKCNRKRKQNKRRQNTVGLETEGVNKSNDERTKNKIIYRLTKCNRKRKQNNLNPVVTRLTKFYLHAFPPKIR